MLKYLKNFPLKKLKNFWKFTNYKFNSISHEQESFSDIAKTEKMEHTIYNIRLRRQTKNLMSCVGFMCSSTFQLTLIDNIKKGRSMAIVTLNVNHCLILKTILLNLWENRNVGSLYLESKVVTNKTYSYFLVDSDEKAMRIINCANVFNNISVVYIRTEADLYLMQLKIVNVFIINYKYFSANSIKLDLKVSNIFSYLIEEADLFNNFVSDYRSVFSKSYSFLIDTKNNRDRVYIYGKYIEVFCSLIMPSQEVIKELFIASIKFKFMCITKENKQDILFTYLTKNEKIKNKKILVLTNSPLSIDLLKTNKIFYNENIIIESAKNLDDDYLNNFDIIIEYCFENNNVIMERTKYLKNTNFDDVEFISLYYVSNIEKVEELRKYDNYSIEVTNILDEIENLDDRENISLISGKPGYYTCLVSLISSAVLLDKYYIFKFFAGEGLTDLNNMDKTLIRIQDTFDYVIDIPCDSYDQVRENGLDNDLRINKLKILPKIYHNRQTKFLKNLL